MGPEQLHDAPGRDWGRHVGVMIGTPFDLGPALEAQARVSA